MTDGAIDRRESVIMLKITHYSTVVLSSSIEFSEQPAAGLFTCMERISLPASPTMHHHYSSVVLSSSIKFAEQLAAGLFTYMHGTHFTSGITHHTPQ
jgi:hypothetical protein